MVMRPSRVALGPAYGASALGLMTFSTSRAGLPMPSQGGLGSAGARADFPVVDEAADAEEAAPSVVAPLPPPHAAARWTVAKAPMRPAAGALKSSWRPRAPTRAASSGRARR